MFTNGFSTNDFGSSDSGLNDSGDNVNIADSEEEETEGVDVPAIPLPEDDADMMGLIVYHNDIYTQTGTDIDAEAAEAIKNEKLGTTTLTIDELSQQEDYSKQLASTTGEEAVYSVKGYDKNFRIMTYNEEDGKQYAEIYEQLNGITINSGADVFGELNLKGNISAAQYRETGEHYESITDMETVNHFVEALNKTEPFLRNQDFDPVSETSQTDKQLLRFKLNDGSKVNLTLIKGGYIYYGHMDAYFKMHDDAFSNLWDQMANNSG